MSFEEDFLDGSFDKGFNYFQNDNESDLSSKTFLFPEGMDKIEINPKYEEKSFFYSEKQTENNFYSVEKTQKKFKVEQKKNRGRQSGLSRKIKHSSSSFDNIQTKIQVHFFSFIINVSNDALFSIFNQKNTYYFKDIDYKLKKKVNHEIFMELKNSSIKNVLKMDISPKYKNFKREHNEKLLKYFSNLSIWLDNFFEMNYIKLFNYYFNDKKPLNKIVFEGKEIILSHRTKSFYDLLKKNSEDKFELIKAAESVYYYEDDNHFFCS